MALTLTVGTNSYVNVTDADEFIRTYYLPGEDIYEWWNTIDQNTQTLYLIRAATTLDRMPITGYKSTSTQTMAFPRNGSSDVPTEVIEAQILLAYSLSLPTSDDPSTRGVKRYSIGDLTEEFFGKTITDYPTCPKEVKQAMGSWLRGGFAIT